MKILFIGTPEFAVPTLLKLIESHHDVIAVYTRKPAKKDRGHQLQKTPIHELAEQNNIPVFTPNKLTEEDKNQIEELNPDVAVAVAYGLLIPKSILKIPKYGILNIHPSLLPRWRGADPIRRPILEGDGETGVSIMEMDEGLDSGDVIEQEKIALEGENLRYENLHKTLSLIGADLMLKTIDKIESDFHNITKIPQDNSKSTYARKIEKEDGKINWQYSAEKIFRQVMALSDSPGVYFEYKGEKIKVLDAEISNDKKSGEKPGYVLESHSSKKDTKLEIACGSGSILLNKLQRPGKKPLEVNEFLRGFPIKVGEIFE